MRQKPPRARADRTRGEILPQLTMACQDPKTRNHKIFTIFLNSRNLHNSEIEHMFDPHRSSYAAIIRAFATEMAYTAHMARTSLYGLASQNQCIRTRSTEPTYTGPAGRTSPFGRPIPAPCAHYAPHRLYGLERQNWSADAREKNFWTFSDKKSSI